MNRITSRAGILGCALLMAVCATTRPSAAQTVTATSGSPAAIASIRQRHAAIEREAPRMRRTRHDLMNFSLEGGELHGFFDGGQLRKLAARQYGETWRGTQEFFFAEGRIFFIHTVVQRYETDLTGPVAATIEHRFYVQDGRLIRRVRTQRPATAADMSAYDPDLPSLLRDAELFAACAASKETECTAPES